MKQTQIFKFLLLVFIVSSCSSNSNNNNTNDLNNFTTDLCTNVSGPTAAYYANAHGVPILPSQIPTLANPGQQFIHSQYPALGFTAPQDYSVFENQVGIGANMVRNDNEVVWRYVPSLTAFSQIEILDIVAAEVNQIFAHYGHTGDFTVDCTQNFSEPYNNFIASLSTRIIRFGSNTALIAVNSYYEPSLGSTFASVTLASGPTTDFDNLVMDVFLPMHWQLMIIDDSVRDSDLDGTPDSQDNFPFDPDRQ